MKIAAVFAAGAAALLAAVLLDVGRRDLPAPPVRAIVLQPATATTATMPTTTVTGPPGTYDPVERDVDSYSDDPRDQSGDSGSGRSGSGSGSGHSGSGTDSGGSGG